MIGAESLSEFNSRIKAHFAISTLLNDQRETWDSGEGLDARSLHAETAASCSAEHGGNSISCRFIVSVSGI